MDYSGEHEDTGDALEREAERRAQMHVVVPPGKQQWELRRFGRRIAWLNAAFTVLLLGFALWAASQGRIDAALRLLPVVALMAAVSGLGYLVHTRAKLSSLLLTPEGLVIDSPLRIGPIPWDEVEDIFLGPVLGWPTLGVKVRDIGTLRKRLSPHDRRLLWICQLQGRVLALNCGFYGNSDEEVLQTMRRYWLYGPAQATSPVVAPAVAAAEQPVPLAEATSTTLPAPPEQAQQTVGRLWWRD